MSPYTLLTALREFTRRDWPWRAVRRLRAAPLVLVPEEVAAVAAARSERAELVVERDAVHCGRERAGVPE